MRRTRGFTLLEVLVALAVVAVALAALVRTAGLGVRALGHERDLVMASWVAANALTEARLRERFPALGRSDGQADMGGRRWRWELAVQTTDEPTVRRLDVRVFPDGSAADAPPTASLIGFAGER